MSKKGIGVMTGTFNGAKTFNRTTLSIKNSKHTDTTDYCQYADGLVFILLFKVSLCRALLNAKRCICY